MGTNKFKLSDMIPNAWFYKLRDMSKSRKRNGSHVMKKNKVTSPTTSQRSQPRYSHHFSIELNGAGKLCNSPIHPKDSNFTFIDSPRRSSKRKTSRKTIYKPSPTVVSSVITSCSCHSTNNWTKPNRTQSSDYYVSSIENSSESDLHEYGSSESEGDRFSVPDLLNRLDSTCSCRVSSSTNDIIIDMNNECFTRNSEKHDGFDKISQLGLAPILTKPVKFDDKVIQATELRSSTTYVKASKEESSRSQREHKISPIARKSSANSAGIRLKVNSPKLASRKVQGYSRRSVSSNACKDSSNNAGFPEGFAVVKSSLDPQRDFRESMVEMIVENNIWASKDLENLLACYLSLNSSEYHDLIVKEFEQIWYGISQLRM